MPSGWFYNDVSGVVRFDSGASYYADLLARSLGSGWHGPYATEALADTHAGITGAKALNNSNPVSAAENAGANVAGSALGLPTLTNTRDLAARAVKVIGGLALIITGLSIIGKGALPAGTPVPIPV